MSGLNVEDIILHESFIELVELIKIDLVKFMHHLDARCHGLNLQTVLLIVRAQKLAQLVFFQGGLGSCDEACHFGCTVFKGCT